MDNDEVIFLNIHSQLKWGFFFHSFWLWIKKKHSAPFPGDSLPHGSIGAEGNSENWIDKDVPQHEGLWNSSCFMLSHDRMSIGAAKWSDGKFRANKKKHFAEQVAGFWEYLTWKVKELNTGVGFILGLPVFYGQCNIYWYVRIKLIKSWDSWWGSKVFFSPKLGKYPSHTTEAPTATQLLSFLSFLEVVERTGYSWWTHKLIRII